MKHQLILNQKPVFSGSASTPDGAITGNGDLAVILGNAPNGLRIYLSKVDLWYLTDRGDTGGVRPLGQIDIQIDPDCYQNYYVEQDMDKALLYCRFQSSVKEYSFTIKVLKTVNAVLIENTGSVPVLPRLKTFENARDGAFGEFTENGFFGIYRAFEGEGCVAPLRAYAAIKPIGASRFLIRALTDNDCDDPKREVISFLQKTGEKRLNALITAHEQAWRDLWARSCFCCNDSLLENAWYTSVYYMAVTMGNRKFPPGLFGNFITVENPAWHSDYHLNYNYQAPFYPALSTNHPEFTDCYAAPLLEFMPRGKVFAGRLGVNGILYPVGIAPKGVCTELTPDRPYAFDRLFLGQKSNAIHAADIMVFRYYMTLDTDYARSCAYPYIKECLTFFMEYGEWKNGVFTVKNDSAHEVPIYKDGFKPRKYPYLKDTNNSLTMGLLRLCLQAGIDMARALNTDEAEQKRWRYVLERLPEFATFIKNGKRVFRYTQKGQAWHKDNDVGLQHIYPAGSVGLESDEKILKIARNTYYERAKTAFDDANAFCSFYPMGARLLINSDLLFTHFKRILNTRRYPNGLFTYEGGCTEYCSTAAAFLNETVLQSHQQKLHLFPYCDLGLNIRFQTLRANGAFLVSSSYENGKMGRTEIISEKGSYLRLCLPEKGKTAYVNGESVFIPENELELPTKPGQKMIIE